MSDQPPGLHEQQIVAREALRRGELWAKMGYPVSKPHMPQHEYDRDYVGRIWFAHERVLDDAQQALKLIFCPNCVEEKKTGDILATRFYTSIEDDVMTVFPAVGHFLCHHCGFEEWLPLKHDPRKVSLGAQSQREYEMQQLRNALEASQKMYPPNQQMGVLGGARGIGGVGASGIGVGGLPDEEAALRRIFDNAMRRAQSAFNPPVLNPKIGGPANKIK